MLRKSTIKYVSLAALVWAGATSVASAGYERQVLGEAGRAVSSSNASCLSLSYGSIKNTCASTVSVDIPLPLDDDYYSHTRTFYLSGSWSGATLPSSCQIVSLDAGFKTVYNHYFNIPGGGQFLQDTSLNTPGGGVVYLNCKMPQNFVINYVSFDPGNNGA